MQAELLEFSAYPVPVRARLAAHMPSMIESLLKGWSVSAVAEMPSPELELLGSPERLTVRGRWVGPPYSVSDPVDGACSFIAETLKAQANESSDSFCVHAAGAVLGDRAVLMLAGFRAGKSTLTAVLAARGERIVADDALFVSEAGAAIAPGILPRLRLPLPEALAPQTRAFVKTSMGLAGRRYGYLTLPGDRLMRNGESAPIGAFVSLNRRPEGPAELVDMPKAEALRMLIRQNFARRIPAGRILACLADLIVSRPTLELRYSDAEAAADIVQERFSAWPEESAQSRSCGLPGVDERLVTDNPRWRVGANVVERQLGNGCFIADEDNGRIFHLNATASAIWRLLSAGEDSAEVASLLGEAFPGVDAGRIGEDVATLAHCFRENGLLIQA
jgi:hypothetical protein